MSRLSDFNSIKVRLERHSSDTPDTGHRHFNSIKVRLELKSRIDMQDALSFQFHKGTIRTNNLLKSKKLHVNFNSIKVRLELINN